MIRPHTPSYPNLATYLSTDHARTTKQRVAIDPAKTALIVVDLQNYFLSPSLGHPPDSVGLKVVDELLEHAIPACRKIVWLGWGLTEQDLEGMPPTIVKGFAADTNFDGPRRVTGLGSDIGPVRLDDDDDGAEVEGGRVMMREQWNTGLYPALAEKAGPRHIRVYKNRLSGFWGGTGVEEALTSRGIRTLLFAGANTDQCVAGSLQDAFAKGWDCLLLNDGCGTSSPAFATRCIEFDCEEGWGFVLTCKGLADGVDNMQTGHGLARR